MAARRPSDLTNLITLRSDQVRAFSSGGLADVWLCLLKDPSSHQTQEVAVKVLRCAKETGQEEVDAVGRALTREIRSWSDLQHPNVLRMYGLCDPASVSKHMGTRIQALVSPYCTNGSIREYLLMHPQANKIALIKQVIEALSYLHGKDIVHGDLKATNILIDSTGRALLADFGLARIVGETGFTTRNQGGTNRYSAPELLEYTEESTATPKVTSATDIWAFAMTTLEILSGSIPFPRLNNVQVINAIGKGARPDVNHYEGVIGEVWQILERCWVKVPSSRPDINTLRSDFAPF